MKLENLTKTYPLMLQRDANGLYILYCDYKHHKGVVIPKQRIDCEEKDCIHLRKFYEENLL